jgi:hypothetical protein
MGAGSGIAERSSGILGRGLLAREDQATEISAEERIGRREWVRAVFVFGAVETRGPRDRNSGRPLTEISTASPQKWHFWLALARYGT